MKELESQLQYGCYQIRHVPAFLYCDGYYDLPIHFYCINCQETHCLPKTQIPEVKLPMGYERQETSL